MWRLLCSNLLERKERVRIICDRVATRAERKVLVGVELNHPRPHQELAAAIARSPNRISSRTTRQPPVWEIEKCDRPREQACLKV